MALPALILNFKLELKITGESSCVFLFCVGIKRTKMISDTQAAKNRNVLKAHDDAPCFSPGSIKRYRLPL